MKQDTNHTNSYKLNNKFIYASIVIVGIYVFVSGLIYLETILAPIAIALLFALSFVPLASKFEKWGMHRTISSLLCTIIVSIVFILIGWAAIEYGADLKRELPKLWEQIKPRINQLSDWIASKFGTGELDLLERSKEYLSSSVPSIGSKTLSFISGTLSSIGSLLLVVVYMFFLLNFRGHIAKFLYKLTSDKHDRNVSEVLHDSVEIVRKYLVGRLVLIVILSVFYGIGYSVIGLDYAWAIAIISALFSILPIIGNIIAAGLSSIVALLTTGEITMVLWVLGIFAAAQFLESYVLTPLILGKEVNLNPFFTVVVVLIGGAAWGFAGYLLALPYFGILKIVLDQSPTTKPYAYLLATEDNGDIGDKIKSKITGSD